MQKPPKKSTTKYKIDITHRLGLGRLGPWVEAVPQDHQQAGDHSPCINTNRQELYNERAILRRTELVLLRDGGRRRDSGDYTRPTPSIPRNTSSAGSRLSHHVRSSHHVLPPSDDWPPHSTSMWVGISGVGWYFFARALVRMAFGLVDGKGFEEYINRKEGEKESSILWGVW